MKDQRTKCVAAGVLFIIATTATMAGFTLTDPILGLPDVAGQVADQRPRFVLGVILEITNALASAGIAMALFPVIWRFTQGLAVAYLGLRVIEAGLGVLAATGLLTLLSADNGAIGIAIHNWGVLLVLMVFSVGALVLYPVLFIYRLVPVVLSVWGLIGGALLLSSVLLILFGRIDIGSMTDTLLSLPIWINEMALALWLIFRGVDLQRAPPSSTKGDVHAG